MAAIERDTMHLDKVIGEHDVLEVLSIYRGACTSETKGAARMIDVQYA